MAKLDFSDLDKPKIDTPIKIFDYKKFYERDTIWTSNKGDKFVILEYINKNNVRIKFLDEYGYESIVQMGDIKRGNVRNPYHPNKYGAMYGSQNIENRKIYKAWSHMFERIEKYDSYKNVIVDKDWYIFENFANWYLEYIKDLNPEFKYQLDKDILQWDYPEKIYSSKTCCLIPQHLNLSLVGLHLKRNIYSDLPVGIDKNRSGKYSSSIIKNGRTVYLGTFDSIEEAFFAYKTEKENHIRELASFFFMKKAIKRDIFDALHRLKISFS